MNSSGIEPRVGMQVKWRREPSEKIIGITKKYIILSSGMSCLHPSNPDATSWPQGAYEIEWIPPTDEEREMFRTAADDFWYRHESYTKGEWIWIEDDSIQQAFADLCEWNMDQAAEIAESLSMDGL